MIEMLGVLAIVGVLSVGGLAGYSKAMQKWKMDKWKAQITELIFSTKDAYIYEKQLNNIRGDILPTLRLIGIIPENMLDKDNRDIFGNNISMDIRHYTFTDANAIHNFAVYFETKASTTAEQNCRELYTFSLTAPDVFAIINWANEYRVCGKSVEDSYKKQYYCYEYNMQQVVEKCKICLIKNCTLILLYRN